jgi:hypothetical protein
MLNPLLPSQLFHPCNPVESLDFASVAVAAVFAHKIKEKLGKITGMKCVLDVNTDKTDMVAVEYKDGEGSVLYIDPSEFVPGSCVFYKTGVDGSVKDLRRLIGTDDDSVAYDLMDRLGLGYVEANGCWFGGENGMKWPPGLKQAIETLGDIELNVALYRCDAEEKDFTNGIS